LTKEIRRPALQFYNKNRYVQRNHSQL